MICMKKISHLFHSCFSSFGLLPEGKKKMVVLMLPSRFAAGGRVNMKYLDWKNKTERLTKQTEWNMLRLRVRSKHNNSKSERGCSSFLFCYSTVLNSSYFKHLPAMQGDEQSNFFFISLFYIFLSFALLPSSFVTFRHFTDTFKSNYTCLQKFPD